MTEGYRMRALGIVLLMTAGTLLGLVPTSVADSNAAIQFDHDPCPLPVEQLNQCFSSPRVDLVTPNYLEGQTVTIAINSQSTPWVRIRCIEGCLGVELGSYYARWNGGSLRFPNDFTQPGPQSDGRNAIADGVPRYNGTWRVTAMLSTGDATRDFNIRLIDTYTSPGGLAQPGAQYLIYGRGYDRSNITIRVDHKEADGSFKTIHGPVAATTPNSILVYRWTVPKSEAERITECNKVAVECGTYRLSVTGGGKEGESVLFGMQPARIDPVSLDSTGAVRRTVERTQNLTATFTFYYPGGTLARGPALRPEDLAASSINPDRTLRVRVENITGINETSLVAEVPMVYTPQLYGWHVQWTAPKNLTLGPSGSADFLLRLPESRDAWGNKIPTVVLGNFTIRSATLAPFVTERFLELERTESGHVTLQFRYHNGSLWNELDNATPLLGCYVRETSSTSCTGAREEERVTGKYAGNGTWTFEARYARDHTPLTTYRFIFPGGSEAQDRSGNRVSGVTLEPFQLTVGSPHIQFKTVMRGLDTTVLERGNRVSVQATITYGDGKPYNHTVAPNKWQDLNVTLVRRSATGEIVQESILPLRETDREVGRWVGSLDLTRDEQTTPLGTWSFRFDVKDELETPNVNLTTFDRRIVAAPITIQPVREPQGLVATGGKVNFRFLLYYEDGSPVPNDAVNSRLEAYVYAHDGTKAVGAPVSGRLIPTADSGVFSVDYNVPTKLYSGKFAFVITGADRFGNELAQGATSRAFATYAESGERSILTQPALSIQRGESAAVVFDGDAGDIGPSAEGAPIIHVQRYDDVRQRWVTEIEDVRQPAEGANDHVGVFYVLETTTIGIYRFMFGGRDADFRPIVATSANFTVEPTEVTRGLYAPPPRTVVKGDLFSMAIERREGDQIRSIETLLNGRPVDVQRPVTTAIGDRTNITWLINFESASGNYSLIIRGYDVYGNNLVVRTPVVEAGSASLSGKVLGNPARFVERGTAAVTLFGITYPTGAFYLSSAVPDVFVYDGDTLISRAEVVRSGLTFQASWTPPPATPPADYRFQISGRGSAGNLFPTLDTETFRVTSGSFERGVTNELPATLDRSRSSAFAVTFDPTDKSAGFEIEYYGTGNDPIAALEAGPVSVTAIPHDLDFDNGRYITQFKTDLATPVGVYRIIMTGEDAQGNVITAKSRTLILRTSPVLVRFDTPPPQTAFGEAKTISFTFTAEYATGQILTPELGTPQHAILYNGAPITDRGELVFENGKWRITWTTPDVLLDGSYTISVGGFDLTGNAIVTQSTPPYPWESTLKTSFIKTVPGAEAWVGLVALVGVALFLRRKQE